MMDGLFMPKENALFTILEEKINKDALVLPTLPEIAIKVQQAAEDPNVNLNQMAKVVSQDPAISMRLIKVANSAVMARAVKVENINQAVTRIGLRQMKSIVLAMAMEQIYRSKSDIVSMYMTKTWQKTVDVAAVAISLMKVFKDQNKHSPLNIESVTLASMVHSIGVLPILTEAEQHPDVFANPTFIDHAIDHLSGKIGNAILTLWNFPKELVDVAAKFNDYSFNNDELAYIDFVRLGAIVCGYIDDEKVTSNLMVSYLTKGLIPSEAFLLSDEFKEMRASVKDMFS
jgi:HD-like signal output (HDOD) protein